MIDYWRRLLGNFPWYSKATCPYCLPIVSLLEVGRDVFKCPSCDTKFEKRHDNAGYDFEPILPNFPSESFPSRRTCIPLEQGKLQLDDGNGIFCRTCQNHQTILLQLLSNYESPMGISEMEEARNIRSFREDLERRYPLCGTCKTRVQERLKIVEYKVRCRRLTSRTKMTITHSRNSNKFQFTLKRFLVMLDLAIVQSLFTFVFLYEYLSNGRYLLPLISKILEVNFLWYPVVLIPSALSIALNVSSVMTCSWTMFLLFMRMAMVRLIAEDAVFLKEITPPPYILLNFACYGILWQLYFSTSFTKVARKIKSSSPSITTPFSISPEIPQSKISPKEDITSKLASWDTALETLTPDSPLTMKFTELGRESKSSPFAVPKLTTIDRKSTSRSMSFRPSLFDGNRFNGLENVFENFSLDENKSKTSSINDPSHSSLLDQFVISAGLLLTRIAIDKHHGLIAIILVLTLGTRGFIWNRLGASLRMAINALTLIRLLWLAGQYNTDTLPNLAIVLMRLPELEGVLDFIILLSR